MVKIFFVACLLSLTQMSHGSMAEDRPPPIEIRESSINSFTAAKFDFHLANNPTPISVVVYTASQSGNTHAYIEKIDLTFGHRRTSINKALLADIDTPNLLRLSTSIVASQGSTDVFVVLYLIDDSTECARRQHLSCGVVEFDWKIGGEVEKIDQRTR